MQARLTHSPLYSGPALPRRLMSPNQWSKNTFQSINWEVPGKALDTVENSAQMCITKFAHEHLPTRRHMHRIGQSETDKCPLCLHIVERNILAHSTQLPKTDRLWPGTLSSARTSSHLLTETLRIKIKPNPISPSSNI